MKYLLAIVTVVLLSPVALLALAITLLAGLSALAVCAVALPVIVVWDWLS
jgi:hypothetical protein